MNSYGGLPLHLMGDYGEKRHFHFSALGNISLGGPLCDSGVHSLQFLPCNWFVVVAADEGDVVIEKCRLRRLWQIESQVADVY